MFFLPYFLIAIALALLIVAASPTREQAAAREPGEPEPEAQTIVAALGSVVWTAIAAFAVAVLIGLSMRG